HFLVGGSFLFGLCHWDRSLQKPRGQLLRQHRTETDSSRGNSQSRKTQMLPAQGSLHDSARLRLSPDFPLEAVAKKGTVPLKPSSWKGTVPFFATASKGKSARTVSPNDHFVIRRQKL